MIFHLVDFNEVLPSPPPPRFWEQAADCLCLWPFDAPLLCTHVELKNTFWSLVPPPKAEQVFRFGFRPGGGAHVLYWMRRMPFGWKCSALVCQVALQRVV